MQLSTQQREDFLETLWGYYARGSRSTLLWRQPDTGGLFDPYKIMVSELMLQQTQVSRVTTKYKEFLNQFPTVRTLAQAELGEVLRTWQGLGYNRRAKFLWLAAQQINQSGLFPQSADSLVKLPGVGINSAGAILAYAWNQPAVFIETNVRTVYIHHFFADESSVLDKAIIELLEQTLDHENPREFYWALMDYGSYLKQTVGNLGRISKEYTKQSRFTGSKRQIRGAVIRLLTDEPRKFSYLEEQIVDMRLQAVLSELIAEGLISQDQATYRL